MNCVNIIYIKGFPQIYVKNQGLASCFNRFFQLHEFNWTSVSSCYKPFRFLFPKLEFHALFSSEMSTDPATTS